MNTNIKQQLTTVTTFSKIVAGILFIAMPFIGFYLGMQYSKEMSALAPVLVLDDKNAPRPKPQAPVMCTQDAKVCLDGSSVGRTGPNCEFAACPTNSDSVADWKTYTNKKLRFSFDYPSAWGVYSDVDGEFSGRKHVGLGVFVQPLNYVEEEASLITPIFKYIQTGKGVTSQPDEVINLKAGHKLSIWYSYNDPLPDGSPNKFLVAAAPLSIEGYKGISFFWNYVDPTNSSPWDTQPSAEEQDRFFKMVKSFKYIR